jgi:hypothetical protein
MNPRVSRSSALASKATGFPIAKMATKLAMGLTLDQIANDITQCVLITFDHACMVDFELCRTTCGGATRGSLQHCMASDADSRCRKAQFWKYLSRWSCFFQQQAAARLCRHTPVMHACVSNCELHLCFMDCEDHSLSSWQIQEKLGHSSVLVNVIVRNFSTCKATSSPSTCA